MISKTTLCDDSVTPGHVAAIICAHADATGADPIVMGTHGLRGIRRLVLGSVAEKVLRHTFLPVLLVRTEIAG